MLDVLWCRQWCITLDLSHRDLAQGAPMFLLLCEVVHLGFVRQAKLGSFYRQHVGCCWA